MSHFGKSPIEHAPHIRFVNAIWAAEGYKLSVGIVQLYDTITGEHKFYWGTARGNNVWHNISVIANHGHRLPVKMVRQWLNASGNPFDENYFKEVS